MIVLGIDPGSRHCGYGLIRSNRNRIEHLASGRISLSRTDPLAERLYRLRDALEGLLGNHTPDVSAVEKVFFAKSAQSALSLGQARGVVLATVAGRGIPVHEVSALEVKKAVTGYGRADKQQVKDMVSVLLGLRERLTEDQADALAVAICEAHQTGGAGRLGAAR